MNRVLNDLIPGRRRDLAHIRERIGLAPLPPLRETLATQLTDTRGFRLAILAIAVLGLMVNAARG
jgi:hypothetical protein